MTQTKMLSPDSIRSDLVAGVVVFLVALPLCLGIALASGAPLFSGVIAGIVGGIVVGSISGSHTSVSGPAAGLTAVVAAQIAHLETFEAFLVAVFLAGVLQIGLGLARAGSLSEFFPSSVIKGLLAAIGIILILKQIPHLFGHDPDPEGDMAFLQPDSENTFSAIYDIIDDIHPGASVIGISCLLFLILWDNSKRLKKLPVPSALIVVVAGVLAKLFFDRVGGAWAIAGNHLVQVPVASSPREFLGFLTFPDFSVLANAAIYTSAVTIALVASLETLLNVEAVDKLDPRKRVTPQNRELVAQGVGNMTCGLIGGLPVTSVIVRSSVNINAGAKSKTSAIFHGVLLLVCVALFPTTLNLIPISCLAAILLLTGYKLASPRIARMMWSEGWPQFLPFTVTVVAIVLTDLLIGILIGLGVSLAFILHSNLRRPIRRVVEHHVEGDILRIELANQVSFLNRASLISTLDEVPRGGHVLIDARNTDYIDPDILDLLREYRDEIAPARGLRLSLVGMKDQYRIEDRILYADYTSRELRDTLTPDDVLKILQEGNERFRSGNRLTRDVNRQLAASFTGQFPLAVVLSCIDSRTPTELVFDLGLGDIFTVRIAGNVARAKVLGSLEYSCKVAGAKLIVVMGHTRCGAVTASIDLFRTHTGAFEATGCDHLDALVGEIQKSIDPDDPRLHEMNTPDLRDAFVDEIAKRNVMHTIDVIRTESVSISDLIRQGSVKIVGAMYNIRTGMVDFFELPAAVADKA